MNGCYGRQVQSYRDTRWTVITVLLCLFISLLFLFAVAPQSILSYHSYHLFNISYIEIYRNLDYLYNEVTILEERQLEDVTKLHLFKSDKEKELELVLVFEFLCYGQLNLCRGPEEILTASLAPCLMCWCCHCVKMLTVSKRGSAHANFLHLYAEASVRGTAVVSWIVFALSRGWPLHSKQSSWKQGSMCRLSASRSWEASWTAPVPTVVTPGERLGMARSLSAAWRFIPFFFPLLCETASAFLRPVAWV